MNRAAILLVDDDRALRHAVGSLLERDGHTVLQAGDGPSALAHLEREAIELVMLDMGLPGMSGLDLLARMRDLDRPPIVVVITADDTPETLLAAIRGQAYRYITKPVSPVAIVAAVADALAASSQATLPIEVISARPEWVEIVVPCVIQMAERLHAFILQLETGLPQDVRESVAQAFRELLCNAIEWGGQLDPNRTVRISCIRAHRMLIYRILDPGQGFNIEALPHAAISNSPDDPIGHAVVREEKGIRPGGLGLVMTRALVDELIYNEARNEVVFIKYLD
ncbi:MAG TPA: response regulator [Vicinamibacterales bacterium]|nr:response regulator [Vicinamibacterales bacterium]